MLCLLESFVHLLSYIQAPGVSCSTLWNLLNFDSSINCITKWLEITTHKKYVVENAGSALFCNLCLSWPFVIFTWLIDFSDDYYSSCHRLLAAFSVFQVLFARVSVVLQSFCALVSWYFQQNICCIRNLPMARAKHKLSFLFWKKVITESHP